MLLTINNLKTYYQTAQGVVKAVDGVSLFIKENEVFGLAGESGCGKSTLIRTIMRLVPQSAWVTADELRFRGNDLLSMSDKEFREKILWQRISLVPQSAMNALNPVYRVGDQIIEAIQTHTDYDRAECVRRVETLFDAVGLQAGLMHSYPHEFSGGMRQRAMIAMSLALGPDLIIMDEPTTGLDVLVQERILRELKEIRQKAETAVSILLITHDISIIAEMSDRIGIMYAGRMMEQAEAFELFNEPYHPYTMGLKNAFPSIRALDRELISIPGSPPNLIEDIPGCVFSARCPFTIPACEEQRPPDLEVKPGHVVHCIRTDCVEEFRQLAGDKRTWRSSKSAM
jgi:peptide/nickel transport system ATP-binding protein